LGTLALVVVSAAAAFYAYKTASSALAAFQRNKASADFEAFLKACVFVDDEATFARSYATVLRNAASLQHAILSSDRKSLLGIDHYDPSLPGAVADVLTTLDKVGIIFHYATNKYVTNEKMIDEQTGNVVIRAYEALASIIGDLRQDDPRLCEGFDEMYSFCKKRQRAKAM
jgi:hypothetical protein